MLIVIVQLFVLFLAFNAYIYKLKKNVSQDVFTFKDSIACMSVNYLNMASDSK